MSSGKVETSIENIVNDLQSISWQQVLNEAITNSLQAKATKIKIKFIQGVLNLNDTKKYIDSIVIEDNGDGFTKDNTKSFKEYKSQYKKKEGCKGIGRFFYLKIFDRVDIESLDKKINFIISKDIDIQDNLENIDNTTIKFTKPKVSFIVNYNKYKNELNDHFLAYFKLLKDKKLSIVIEVYENNIKQFEIKSDDIPKFKTKKFKINTHDFNINYILNDNNVSSYDGFYCAGGRVVIKNSHLDSSKKFKFFKDVNILFLLSSKYLDNNVNETRDDFTIYPKQKNGDLFHNLSWSEIQFELKNQINQIAKENGIDIDELSKKSRQKALENVPFLAYYLQNNKNNDDYETLIRNAKKRLEEDKNYIRDNKDKMDSNYQEKLSIITQAELAEYIFDRQNKINELKKLTNDESLEKEIHNLFMKPKTKDEEQNYKTNNLWLFDDRFMSYNKVFSDKQIKKIFPQLSENLERPDILSIGEMSIISNTYEKEYITDIVIIELKKASEKITPARAEEQLVDHAGYINEAYENRKVRIWTYAFLKFDEKTEKSLKNKGYNRVLTKSEYPLYYHSFNEVNKYLSKKNTNYQKLKKVTNARQKLVGATGSFKSF